MMQKKVLYIIGGAVIILIIAAFAGIRAMSGLSGVNYQQNLNGTQTYSNSEGSVTVGNTTMPSDWPSDAPGNYAGAKIIFSGSSNPSTGKTGAAVAYAVTGVSAQTVADYYKNALTSKGWSIDGNANVGSQIIISAKKDTRTFGVSIVDSGNNTTTVTAGLDR